MNVGFIGLGAMGRNIVNNMLKSGSHITVCDVKKENLAEFNERGIPSTTDFLDLINSDIIFLCLPGSKVVSSIILGDKGLAGQLESGKIIVDLSTITYTVTMEIASRLKEKGIFFLDSPVSGMEARAKEGTLTVMCGGEIEVFEKVKPLLKHIGNKILYMGGNGTGQFTKLINQLLFDINMAALAEILPLAMKMNLDPGKVGEVVNSGTGRSYASEFFIPRILKRNFSEGYPMGAAYKDLISGAEISANMSIPLPVLHAATSTYQAALLKGYGNDDKGAMIKVFEELLGVEYKSF